MDHHRQVMGVEEEDPHNIHHREGSFISTEHVVVVGEAVDGPEH